MAEMQLYVLYTEGRSVLGCLANSPENAATQLGGELGDTVADVNGEVGWKITLPRGLFHPFWDQCYFSIPSGCVVRGQRQVILDLEDPSLRLKAIPMILCLSEEPPKDS
jgi:hypothetical protein